MKASITDYQTPFTLGIVALVVIFAVVSFGFVSVNDSKKETVTQAEVESKPEKLETPEYRFKDSVEITSGFYAGQKAILKGGALCKCNYLLLLNVCDDQNDLSDKCKLELNLPPDQFKKVN